LVWVVVGVVVGVGVGVGVTASNGWLGWAPTNELSVDD